MYHIDKATPLDGHRMSLRFSDGFEGEVSLATEISNGGVFAFLAEKARFREIRIGEEGRWIFWTDPDGDEIDLCADALRYEAEERAVQKLVAAE